VESESAESYIPRSLKVNRGGTSRLLAIRPRSFAQAKPAPLSLGWTVFKMWGTWLPLRPFSCCANLSVLLLFVSGRKALCIV
jgi:hypothetical protein